MSEHAVVLTTAGSEDEASRIASALVEGRLAACVSVVPGVLSTYRWKGSVHTDREWMLIVKTRRDAFDRVRAAIVAAHSYDQPEIVLLPIDAGDPGYLAWIDACVDR